MADPGEGVAADGTIRTGAHRDRVPAIFEPVMADAVAFLRQSGASLYVYGSVANGTARPGSSDVDLLSVDLPDAAVLGQRLSARYAGICRGVEFAAATAADLAGAGVSSSPTSPPSWACCTRGPATRAAPHARKPGARWPATASSPRSSSASTA